MKRATATVTCFAVMLAMTAAFALAQQRIDVEAGQNTLLDALAQAQPGDTLVLVTDGGAYENDDELRVEMPLTIMAADTLYDRPVLTNNGDDSTRDIIRMYNDLTLIGLEFDGLAGTDKKAKYAIRNSSGSDQANVKMGYVLKILDCYFHDIVSGSDGNAFRAYWDTYADSIIVRNTLVRNTGKEAIRVRDEDNERPGFGFFNVKYFEVSNSTFWDIKNDAISVYGGDDDPNTDGPEVVIDHVTIYNAGHYLINLKDVENASITNSILMNNYDIVNGTNKTLGAPWLVPGSRIAYTDTLNISDDGDWTGDRGDPTIENLYAVDPMFADPDNGDFTILEGSPVIGMGEDGSTLGDSRWSSDDDSEVTIVLVAPGQNTLLDAVNAAGPGDVIILSGGEYLNDSDINIYEPISILAAHGLDKKPVIKNNEPDESTRVIFDIFDSLHLDGVEIDGQAGTEFNAKYLLRIRNSGSNMVDSSMVLLVTNSYIHDVVAGSDGNFLRQYTETYADSIIFNNVVFNNSGKEGIRIKDESSERPNMGHYNVGFFMVNNTTMSNTANAAIYVYGGDSDPATPEPEFIVNQLTCFNCGYKNGRSIWPRDIYGATIINSNIANSKDDAEYTIKLYGDSQISHTNLFAVSPLVLEGNSMSSNMYEVDPQFANPDALNFTLPAGSPLLTASTDGGPVGDPQWDPARRIGIVEDVVPGVQGGFLGQNYPNPFNGQTMIPYRVDRPAHVRLEVYDILGRRVARIADGMHTPGEYHVELAMPQQAPGHYLFTLMIDGQVQRRTLVLTR